MKKKFNSFKEFYPYYIGEHENKYNKLLHFIGTTLFLIFFINLIFTAEIKYLAYAFLSGYGCAWFGHFFIEKNKPATFTYPLYSFVADHLMYIEILRGKHRIL